MIEIVINTTTMLFDGGIFFFWTETWEFGNLDIEGMRFIF